MSDSDDYHEEMFNARGLDDDVIDAILSGRDPGGADLAALVTFADQARAVARGPVPVPSPALASILTNGLPGDAGGAPGREATAITAPKKSTRKRAAAQFLAGLSIGAKVALGAGIAAASVTAAGAAGVLPEGLQHTVASTVSAVTPFEFPDQANTHADHGKTTSSDATGASDGQPGVDPHSVSSGAADNGLTTASQTPAGDHVPTSVPAGPPADPGAQSSNSSNADSAHPDTTNSDRSNSEHGTPPPDPGAPVSPANDTASATPGGAHLPPSVPRGAP